MARLFMALERVGVVGAELGLPQGQRLLAELEGLAYRPRSSSWWPGRFMLSSVSGWSGPRSRL